MNEKINLVAYDGSEDGEKALKKAVKIAFNDKSVHLYILHVLKPFGSLSGYPWVSYKQISEKMMEEVKESLRMLDNPLDIKIIEGNPAPEIVRFAKEINADMIILGNRGLSGLKGCLGSVSHHVVEKAHCTVMVVK
ncbi:universal stress protein [Ferviditalea candida]|uniref:Universal stress protein n=1 Tax=Ferviditalea candida TaxID=3108399 RepID=A0ABU5ZMZ8_9BACL|nr:universal stress protein [Paenibacillaceae bacterium T2]